MAHSLVTPSEMKLADDIRLFDGAYGNAVVYKIDSTNVHLFRPYMATSDFAMSDSVIPFIGHEIVILPLYSEYRYPLL